MTRTSGVRLAAGVIVALSVVPLSGCLYAQIPENPPIIDYDPVETDAPVDEPTVAPAAGMSFADGADLASTAYVQWGDGLFADDGWQIVQSDNGDGGWIYGTADGTCTAQFWQGRIADIGLVPGDDSLNSDAMIATFLEGGATTAEITSLAETAGFSYQFGGNTDVENRTISGSGDGRAWRLGARAFTSVGVGVLVIVDCTGGAIDSVWADVVDKSAVVITG